MLFVVQSYFVLTQRFQKETGLGGRILQLRQQEGRNRNCKDKEGLSRFHSYGKIVDDPQNNDDTYWAGPAKEMK